MARQCCRDSVAMWIIAHGTTEGDLVPCRWSCESYARYEQGRWHYAVDEPIERRHATLVQLFPGLQRQQRIADVLGKPLLPCHTCGHQLVTPPADNVCPVCTQDFAQRPGSQSEPQGTLAEVEMDIARLRGKQWHDI